MPSIFKMLALLSVLLVAACGPGMQVPETATAIVGTKAVIKVHRNELVAEVTDVTGRLVTTEFSNWAGEFLYNRTEYRGLIPVSGTEADGGQWELDFDERHLEAIFPLRPGKEVAFKGTLIDIERGTSFEMWGHIEVVGEKILDLPTGKRKVVVLNFTREYSRKDKTKRQIDIIYYDPEYSMILKKVIRSQGAQTYWRVVKVERPGKPGNTPTTRQRRSGTVMI